MLVTSDPALAQRLRRLRVHGGKTEYHHDEVGINSRLDALQAAILRVKFKYLDGWSEHIFHQYVIRAPQQSNAVIKHLLRHGVSSKVYYPVPLHLQKCFTNLGYSNGQFPEAERAATETLALPCYPEITEGQQRYVVDVLAKFVPEMSA